jgi:hypothetical protein
MRTALQDAATAHHGTTLAAWEEALRAAVQSLLELAVLRLSQSAPDLLSDTGAKFVCLDLVLPLPAGERMRFRASLELVE